MCKKDLQVGLIHYVCGIDEVGRGSLSGPLVVAAVLLPKRTKKKFLKDSKIMTEQERNKAYKWIVSNCMHSVVFIDVHTIDQKNIYEATRYAMKKVFIQLVETYSLDVSCITELITDAMAITVPPFYMHKDLCKKNPPKAESVYPSVAAASIVAKVTRDTWMKKISPLFPAFSMDTHKGYGAAVHVEALHCHGPSLIHRRSFLSKIVRIKNNDGSQQSLF